MDTPDNKTLALSRMMSDLAFAHLIDLHGGQITIDVKDLDYKNCVVRMELNQETHQLTLKLMTTEYCNETQDPPDVILGS